MTKLKAGDIFQFKKAILKSEVLRFAELTGDFNPLHIKRGVVHGMHVASLTSRLIGMELDLPEALWAEQHLQFVSPVFIGDKLQFIVEVLQVSNAAESVRIRVKVIKKDTLVLEGEGLVKMRYGK